MESNSTGRVCEMAKVSSVIGQMPPESPCYHGQKSADWNEPVNFKKKKRGGGGLNGKEVSESSQLFRVPCLDACALQCLALMAEFIRVVLRSFKLSRLNIFTDVSPIKPENSPMPSLQATL